MRTNRLIGWIVGLLVIQYALGMLANMYSDIPNSEPWQVFHQPGFITFHTLTGVALLVLAIAYVVLRKRAHLPIRRGAAGLVNIVLAFIFGVLFVRFQNDILSLLMALAFLGAFVNYVIELMAKPQAKGSGK